jgi:hypothetical protein
MTVASWPSAMTIVDVYTLLLEILLEAAVLAALFAMLWLAFWVRDRHPDARLVGQPRPTDAPVSDITSAQRDFATVARPLAPVRIASGGRRTIHLASSVVQPQEPNAKSEPNPSVAAPSQVTLTKTSLIGDPRPSSRSLIPGP